MGCGAMKFNDALKTSVLADISVLPLESPETVKSWGATLVIAPHPDDESLGCGGAIALLRRFAMPVNILVISDGTLSHPNSKQFPAPALGELREREMLAALEILGVTSDKATFWRYRDRSVPDSKSGDFGQAVERCRSYLQQVKPQTVLLPWRRDPHPDHRASTEIIFETVRMLGQAPRLIEYPIWIWELAEASDAPRADEVRAWRLDISSANEQKQTAIMAHRSQTTDLIKDDPNGFRLTPEILANFAAPFEIYLESI